MIYNLRDRQLKNPSWLAKKMKLGTIVILLLATLPLFDGEPFSTRLSPIVTTETVKDEVERAPIAQTERKRIQQECVRCMTRTWSTNQEMCSTCYLAFRDNRAVNSTIEELLGLKDTNEAAMDLANRFSKKAERSKAEQAVSDLLAHRFHIACDGFNGYMGNTDGRGYNELMDLLKFFSMHKAMVTLKEYRTKDPSDYKAFSDWEQRLRDTITDEEILQYVRTHRQEFK